MSITIFLLAAMALMYFSANLVGNFGLREFSAYSAKFIIRIFAFLASMVVYFVILYSLDTTTGVSVWILSTAAFFGLVTWLASVGIWQSESCHKVYWTSVALFEVFVGCQIVTL